MVGIHWRYEDYQSHPTGRVRKGKNELTVRLHKSGERCLRETHPDDTAYLMFDELDDDIYLHRLEMRLASAPRPAA